jgi:mannitol-1-phosphate 5-dehydrogenase
LLAVHFGAGNIGRGFIGQLLHESGYEIVFVDVRENVVGSLKTEGRYEVILADEDSKHILIDRVSALHSVRDAEEVTRRLAEADLVTTAVGASVLPVIAPQVAEGLVERARRAGPPVNVIACENMVGASEALRGFVMEHVPEEDRNAVEEIAGFPNAAVDRIVPEQGATM